MEVWKPVKGFSNYEISSKGRTRSVKHKKPFIHKERLNVDGYVKATFRKDGKAYETTVHRLVAKHFIENPDNLETVNHKNGIKNDNRVENLEWMTRAEQMQHAHDLGLRRVPQGAEVHNSVLTDEQVRYIRDVHVKGSRKFGASALARKFDVSPSTIDNVVNEITYILVE